MYCEKCGAQLGSCALFCNNCGACVTQNAENEEKNTDIAVEIETVAVSVAPKSNTAKNVMLIVRNSLIMLLAAVMLAFSFLPVISVGTDYSGVDVKMHLSPIDSIRITIDSFFEYSSPDESHVYGYISELSEELSDEIGTTVKDKEILKNRLNIHKREGKQEIDLILTYTEAYSSSILSYVNTGITDSGPHITQIKTAITRELNKFCREKK